MRVFTHFALLKSPETKQKSNRFTALLNLTKTFTVLFVALISFSSLNATIKTVVGNSGQGWTNASNWSPSGVPQAGDEVVIPVGQTISVKGTVYSLPFPQMIIKVFGTLDFDPSGKLDLASGSIINVYNAGQITSSGTSSEIININGVTKFNGQLDGTITGPSYASNGTGTSPNGFAAGTLAIKISTFSYQLINATVKLHWTAVHDNPNDRFDVQRKTGNVWSSLAVISAEGNTQELNDYSFTDLSPAKSINLYRIRLLNADAGENYSKTIAVSLLSNIESLSAFPNPAGSGSTITWKAGNQNQPVYLDVYNATMNRVLHKQIETGINSYYVDLSKYQSGLYTVTVSTAEGKQSISILVNN